MKCNWLILFLCCVALMACDSHTKRLQQAQTLYEEGVELREQRQSEEAAERFMQGLAVLQKTNKTTDVIRLEGNLCDNLGAMYLKHGLYEDAFSQHQQALKCFNDIADSAGMMSAYRNIGRAERALEKFAEAKIYYDSAFNIATIINNNEMLGALYLEMGRDYYLEIGDFAKGIENVEKALEIGLSDNDIDIAYMTLGVLYYYNNYYNRDFEKAKSYLNKALRSERVGLKMSVYQTLCAIAFAENDYQQTIKYYDLYATSLIEANAEHSREAMQRIKSEYDLKLQQNELESLHRNHDLKLYLIIALIVIALLVILLIIRKKNQEQQIKMEVINNLMVRNRIMSAAKALSKEVNNETLTFTLTDNDWIDFVSLTDLIFNGFSKRLMQFYPKLGESDVRICCLAKNGFSNHVISILLNTQTDSYYKRKTRIKQTKMDLGNDERSFEEIINAV